MVEENTVKVYTLTLTNMIDEYLKSTPYEFINQLPDPDFFKLCELSGMHDLSLKDFQEIYNMHDLKIDFIRFKIN
jgi:hypothetical protein